MKYGVITVKPVSEQMDRAFVNLGDTIQTEAVIYIYQLMGIKNEDIVRIDLCEINSYSGEYVVLPININLSSNWIVNIFPLPNRIIPVFIGLSYFTADKFSNELAEYFRRFAPIGCRDEATLETMRENGIEAYLYGCITATLPRDEDRIGGNKIFCVDVPKSFSDWASNKLEKCGYEVEIVSHIQSSPLFHDATYMEKVTNDLLEKYKKEAKVVITSRLHCMSPCMAMGIPVIAVSDNISHRMGWIDRFLNIYSPETYDSIDWNGQTVEYELVKKKMIDIAIRKIQSTVKKYEEMADLSYFYETREKAPYGNYFLSRLEFVPENKKEKFEYIIWGAGQIGMNTCRVVKQKFPNSRLKAVVDSYCEGTFQGIPIQRPDIITTDTKEIILITTTSGEACARAKMSELGKVENIDYISMATTAG